MGRAVRVACRFLACCAPLAASGLLTGCTHYEPLALDTRPRLAAGTAAIDGGGGRQITIAKLDRLVAINNPDLRAARARLGVGEAQIIQAGILPNPQLNLSYPFLVAGPGTNDGFALGLAQDVRSLLLRPTKGEVAANAASEIRASLLWQEWQTIGKARLLFVDIVSGEKTKKLIVKSLKLLKVRFGLARASVDQGNGTLANLSPDLVALGDVQKAADDVERLQLSRRHQLNLLLGVRPDAPLDLYAGSKVPRVDSGSVRHTLATLAERRPDLIALQYGYRSEDAKLRQAILSQFPNLTVGVTGGRDTQDIFSLGPQVTIDLPIFDRNQGAIATEEATREQLNREFNARLTTATGEVSALISEQELLSRQLASVELRLKEARVIADKTEAAYKQGSFDERTYVDIQVAMLNREQEKIALQQALLEGQVGLATLVGSGMPHVRIAPEPPPADPIGMLRAMSRL